MTQSFIRSSEIRTWCCCPHTSVAANQVDARNKMAVSLSSQLMTFNAENEYDNQISRMDEVEDLSTCSVCFSEYNSDKRIAKFLPCFHTFCLECLRVNNFSILKELFFNPLYHVSHCRHPL